MIYLSRRDTALIDSDAADILAMSADEYRVAVSAGKLRRSIRIANDPTGRLAFHSFWDIFEFSLRQTLVPAPEVESACPQLIDDICDHLAVSDDDVVVGTGDGAADMEILEERWNDETGVWALPIDVVRLYAQLILRTLQRLRTIIEAISATEIVRCVVSGEEYPANDSMPPMRLIA